jgi:hypothetical protein
MILLSGENLPTRTAGSQALIHFASRIQLTLNYPLARSGQMMAYWSLSTLRKAAVTEFNCFLRFNKSLMR